MAQRHTHERARTEAPRMKDVPVLETVREPSEGRDAQGRFELGNRAANGAGVKALIRRSLGDPADPLTKDVERLYRGLLRALPSTGPGVRQYVAGQAREGTLAAFYNDAARKAGLASPEGLKLADAARSHELASQRLGVSAYDLSVREANQKPEGASLVDFIGGVALKPINGGRQ